MPANLVNLERVRLRYGTRTVLDGVSLGVARGDRIGVVGRNGAGKSTLLRVLAGREQPESGRVTHTGGLAVEVLGQHVRLDPAATVRATVVGAAAEHEWAADPHARAILGALLADVSLDARVGPLSGGERRRVALARALLSEGARGGLLVLDEPTNHLDVEGIDWLADHLAARAGALVVVTHDRWFLDTAALTTWEVVDGRVETYDGGYSGYVLARAERLRAAAADEARRQGLLRKELAWLRRGPPARTSKPRFRIEAANALIADEPPARDRLTLARFAAARLGKDVVDLAAVSVARGGRVLLADLTWALGPGDRVGLVGVNGSGKTTLLRLLDGSLPPDAGRVRRGSTVSLAHLTQEVAGLDPDRRVLQAVEDVGRALRLGVARRPKGALGRTAVRDDSAEVTASQLLERFGFAGDAQWTPVGELSGGERRRLQLLRLLMAEPNVLLLDEPTNDLDIETFTVLEDLLDGWAGSLVVVSHDRWFLERVTDTTWALLGDGTLRLLPGGVDDYLERRRALVAASAAVATDPAAGGSVRRNRGDSRSAGKELARLERELERLARRGQRLHDELAAHATDHERVLALDADLRALTAERERLESRWLELAEDVG